MQEIKPDWKIAYIVLRYHTIISAGLLLGCFILGTAFVSLVLHVQGEVVNLDVLHQIYIKNRGLISSMLFALYAYPVSYYAAIKSWQHKYKNFHIVIYQRVQPESKAGIDNVAS